MIRLLDPHYRQLPHCYVLLCILFMPSLVLAQATDVDCAKCVDQGDIAPKAVTTGKLGNQSVGKEQLADAAVTADKLAGGSVSQGKIRDGVVTTAKIRDGAITPSRATPRLSRDLGDSCPDGQVVVGRNNNGSLACGEPGMGPATCEELAYSGTLWGVPVEGLDLRARTGGSINFIGAPAGFFACEDSIDSLAFAATEDFLYVLVDPYNSDPDDEMTSAEGIDCCSTENPDGICFGPDTLRNAVALCRALGYSQIEEGGPSLVGGECPVADTGTDGTSGWHFGPAAEPGAIAFYACTDPL